MRDTRLMIVANQCPDIIIDMDDVLCSTTPKLIQLLNEQMGTNFSVNDIFDHDLTKVFSDLHVDDVSQIIITNDLLVNLDPIPHTKEALQSLTNAGYNIHICTARKHLPQAQDQTYDWFDLNNITLQNPILFTNFGEPKSLTYSKVASCFSYMFDDSASNIEDAILHGAVIKPTAITQPWNIHHNHFLRTPSLFDFCKDHGLLNES